MVLTMANCTPIIDAADARRAAGGKLRGERAGDWLVVMFFAFLAGCVLAVVL